jgi:hypothetical protein
VKAEESGDEPSTSRQGACEFFTLPLFCVALTYSHEHHHSWR